MRPIYYYRARFYDPVRGRFNNRDPLGVWFDIMNAGNSYSYVANNPLNAFDPLGLTGFRFANNVQSNNPSFQSKVKAGARLAGQSSQTKEVFKKVAAEVDVIVFAATERLESEGDRVPAQTFPTADANGNMSDEIHLEIDIGWAMVEAAEQGISLEAFLSKVLTHEACHMDHIRGRVGMPESSLPSDGEQQADAFTDGEPINSASGKLMQTLMPWQSR